MTPLQARLKAIEAAQRAERYLQSREAPDTARARASAEIAKAWAVIAVAMEVAP